MASAAVVSLGNVALRGVTMLGRFGLILALANFLRPGEVGLFSLITAAVTWGIYLQGLEFYMHNLRALVSADPREWARRTRDAFVLYATVFGGATLVWVLLFYAGVLPWSVFGWFIAILALEHIAQESYRLLNVFRRPLAGSIVLFARSGLWMYLVAFVMWLVPANRTLDFVLHAWVIGVASSVLLAMVFVRDLPWRGLPPVEWRWLRRGLRVALPLLVGSLAFRGMALFDRWYLGETTNGAELGVYGFFAAITGALPTLAESGIGAVIYPAMMKAWQERDLPAYRASARRLVASFAAFLALAVPGAAVAVWIVVGHLREAVYAANLDVFGLLLASAAVTSLIAIPQYALWAKQRDRSLIASSVFGLVVTVVLDLLLVPTHGALGAAWGQLGASTAMLVVSVLASRGP